MLFFSSRKAIILGRFAHKLKKFSFLLITRAIIHYTVEFLYSEYIVGNDEDDLFAIIAFL